MLEIMCITSKNEWFVVARCLQELVTNREIFLLKFKAISYRTIMQALFLHGLCIYSVNLSIVIAFHVKPLSRSTSKLHSFGDPSNSPKSLVYRQLQTFYRWIDNKIIFIDDPDTPGLTFTSPIEWAPWMETIWFGNAYDYKSAYFHDVMYSNNVPCREGALLFKDRTKANQIALLYQRYKRFDQSSYSLSNATFFNIFGDETLRIGRYKVPVSDELILCVTDPLTFSEMKRYLTSFNVFKYFKSKFFQQKRKRQISIQMQTSESKFFDKVVQFIEYGRIVDKVGEDMSISIPIIPVDTKQYDGSLVFPMSQANSQYFLESLFQSTLTILSQHVNLRTSSILIGGDGRMLNEYAALVFCRVAAGNQVSSVVLSKSNLLTTSAAKEYLIDNPSIECAIVMTAPTQQGGVKGAFGIQLVLAERIRKKLPEISRAILAHMSTLDRVSLVPKQSLPLDTKPFKLGSTNIVTARDVAFDYVASLVSLYDMDRIKAYLKDNDIYFTVDAFHGGAANSIATLLLDVLGVDVAASLINRDVQCDFGGLVPSPAPASCEATMDLFDPYFLDGPAISESVQRQLGTQTEAGRLVSNSCYVFSGGSSIGEAPDFGFVLNADASECMVVGSGVVLSREEALGVVRRRPAGARSSDYGSDGIKLLLEWLQLLTDSDSIEIKSTLQSQWVSQGYRLHTVNSSIDLSQDSYNIAMEALACIRNDTTLSQLTYTFPADDTALFPVTLSSKNRVTTTIEAPSSTPAGKTLTLCTTVTSQNYTISAGYHNQLSRDVISAIAVVLQELELSDDDDAISSIVSTSPN